MIGINNTMRTANMQENCGMKGMHENHAQHTQKVEVETAKQQNIQIDKISDGKVGTKLDVRI